MSGTEKIIEIEGMTKRYGKHRGVEDLNLSVERGEIFGFLGPNGLRYKLKNLSSTSLR